jgi:hydroxymethylpyrimidine pyrophosphatase-like HAD family hydrolase
MGRGCEVVLATGRRLQSVEPIAAQLGITTVIMTDGTVVFDLVGRRALYERALTSDLVRRAVALTVDAEISPIIYESPAIGGRMIAGPLHLDGPEAGLFLRHRADVHRLPIADLASIERVIAIIAIGVVGRVDRLAAWGEEHGGFTMIRWYPTAVGYHHDTVTFAPPETSKGHALRWLAADRGIPIESTLAIGDYENDVSLLAAAGIGIAMGNAVMSVKRVARAVVSDNENDGVAEAIERWILR